MSENKKEPEEVMPPKKPTEDKNKIKKRKNRDQATLSLKDEEKGYK